MLRRTWAPTVDSSLHEQVEALVPRSPEGASVGNSLEESTRWSESRSLARPIEKDGDHALAEREGYRKRLLNEQKKQMVERLTDAMVSIEGESMRGVTWVVVEEVKSGDSGIGNWGIGDWEIGGNALTTADVKALAAQVPVA